MEWEFFEMISRWWSTQMAYWQGEACDLCWWEDFPSLLSSLNWFIYDRSSRELGWRVQNSLPGSTILLWSGFLPVQLHDCRIFIFTCIFHNISRRQELLQDKIKSKKPCFDLVSTQFVLHYAFDKLESADRFLRNAAEYLRDGGYFIGTTVNSCRVVYVCETILTRRNHPVFSLPLC